MSYQPQPGSSPDPWIKSARLEPFIGNCYRAALERLGSAYAARRPAVVLVSQGRIGPQLVIDRFLERLDQDVTVVRVNDECTDAISCMRQIIDGLGFDPVKMDLNSLEGVLNMYLAYQRSKKLRTVIAFENQGAKDWWIHDKIRRLIESETQEKYGLMVIRAEFPVVNGAENRPNLVELNPQSTDRIILSPFTLAETREFVRQKLQYQDGEHFQVDDVSRIFDFNAVNLIHEYSSGVPEYVERLCNRCLRLMRDIGESEVTVDIVRNAANLLGMDKTLHAVDVTKSANQLDDIVVQPGQLVIQVPGEADQEMPLTQNCILIGRDLLCAICVPGLKVSRYHAIIAMSPQGLQFLDLGSTNGSRVNGDAVSRCTLRDGDVIGIGQTTIRYVAGGEAITWTESSLPARDFETCAETPEPSITHIGNSLDNGNGASHANGDGRQRNS